MSYGYHLQPALKQRDLNVLKYTLYYLLTGNKIITFIEISHIG